MHVHVGRRGRPLAPASHARASPRVAVPPGAATQPRARLNTDAAQETLCAPLRLCRARDGSAETSTTAIPQLELLAILRVDGSVSLFFT